MYNILICDDEPDIVSALKIYLEAEGYAAFLARNGREALDIIDEREIHLVLMDIMMPELDGIASTIRLREKSNIPVIMLTAKGADNDKVLGLNVGADDYVTKPFNPIELTARVKSQLRRYMRLGGAPGRPENLRCGPIELDDGAKTVTLDGEPVSLTPTEFGILRLLMQNPGRVFGTKEIYRAVRSGDNFGNEGTVAVHIRHLREKLEIDPAEPRHLKVVWGQGYRLGGGAVR